MTDKQRPVVIRLEHGTYFVRYVDRFKFQRYSAAQFDAGMFSLNDVQAWVRNSPNLRLLEMLLHNEE